MKSAVIVLVDQGREGKCAGRRAPTAIYRRPVS